MTFEAIGQFFFLRMRPLFFFFLALTPCVLAGLWIGFESSEQADLQTRFQAAIRLEKNTAATAERKTRFLARYSHANPYFLDQEIEALPLLQTERKKLMALLSHPAFPNHQALQKRLHALEANRLNFIEGAIRTADNILEVEEKQKESVEMDQEDLQQLLALIENVAVGSYLPKKGSPQMIITDFHLKKKITPFQTEHLEVEMDLLKREFQ
jgi:hypothetical protein